MAARKKATDDQLRAAYVELDSVWKVAERFGMCGQSVHERLQKLGLAKPINVFTPEDDAYLMQHYPWHAERGELDALAQRMGRTKQFICRQAKRLGLTDKTRKKTWADPAELSARSKAMIKANGHPRGMAGKSHTQATKARLAEVSSAKWAAMSGDERATFTLTAMKAKVAKYGTMAPPRLGTTWKAGWREIGGQRNYYRSRWEANYARYLQWLLRNKQILGWKHEPKTFWFEAIKRGVRSYLPDFEVVELDGSVRYHEVKGWMDPASKTKIARMARYYPEVRLLVIDAKAYKAIAKKAGMLVPEWESGK